MIIVCVINSYNLTIFLLKLIYRKKKINDETIELWQSTKCSQTNKFYSYYIINMFSKFLNNLNYNDVIVREKNPFHYGHYIPYIYTKEELKQIFSESKINNNHLYIALHLLYNCGLRISEVSNLKVKNLNCQDKTILIEKSKNGKTRLIPLGDKIFKLLNKYVMSQNISKNEYIFYNNKTRLNTNNYYIRTPFRKILKKLGISKKYNNQLPRIHDLRHTFAVHALEQMKRNGFDLYTTLPILSVYMGHTSILETEYYLRLIPEFGNNILTSKEYVKNLYTIKEHYYE